MRRSDLRLIIFRKGSCSEPWVRGKEEIVRKECGEISGFGWCTIYLLPLEEK